MRFSREVDTDTTFRLDAAELKAMMDERVWCMMVVVYYHSAVLCRLSINMCPVVDVSVRLTVQPWRLYIAYECISKRGCYLLLNLMTSCVTDPKCY